MYEQLAHSLLNSILDRLTPRPQRDDLRHFYTRLGANFYAIHSLFCQLYGHRDDVEERLFHLVDVMARQYLQRAEPLRERDVARERDHNWFLSQEWVGMALYVEGFNDDLNGLRSRLPYLQELGVNMLHVMPITESPEGASDGGYAVKDFRRLRADVGDLDDLGVLTEALRRRDMLLTMDVVVNHTSNEHEWAQRARAGEARYQEYYYVFGDRELPDLYEETMPEVFPETAPGNFTYDENMEKWVMTVFNHYQWDLNYGNPAVFIEMLDILLFWANQGADILRLDAVAFLWKKLGTASQNEREAHLLLQLFKDCCQVTAPGVLFIAEAIVAPVEITKYFGEDAIVAKECEIAYNATFMALMWDAIATKNARLLNQGVRNLPDKLDRATWLNYIRGHDDIGLGFDDLDIRAAGYEPQAHRRFLVDYFTGEYGDSPARGRPFARNEKTGDARISGTLASLVGLERAMERQDPAEIDHSIDQILLLHSLILSFGGIPVLYYGDEIGTLNDASFLEDARKSFDNRWMHRPRYDWSKVEKRKQRGSIENRLFHGIQRMVNARKLIPAFADYNNRELIDVHNDHLFVLIRGDFDCPEESVLVVANFNDHPQALDLDDLHNRGRFTLGKLRDLVTGDAPTFLEGQLIVPAYHCYWLKLAASL